MEMMSATAVHHLRQPTYIKLSVARHLRVTIRMVEGVAERFGSGARALHEEADIEFVRHADTAVHLHRFVRRESRNFARTSLRETNHHRCVRFLCVERLQCTQRHRAQQLDLAEQMRGSMLKRLKTADLRAELFAFA